jgi:hypothetical protein
MQQKTFSKGWHSMLEGKGREGKGREGKHHYGFLIFRSFEPFESF